MRTLFTTFGVLFYACGPATTAAPPAEEPQSSASSTPIEAKPTSQVAPLPCTELDFEGCKAACEKGSARACTLAAVAVREDRRGDAAQKAAAPGLLEKACHGGDPEGCRYLGHAYEEGAGVSKDPARAAELYKKAFASFESGCAQGRAESCELLGHMIGNGWGTAKNESADKPLRKKAIELYAVACGPADPASCSPAAAAYESGFYVEKDLERSLKLLTTGCDANDPESCFSLGLASSLGVGGAKKDEAAGAALLRKACDGGSLKACSTLGEMMAAGKGVPKDGAAALKLLERACSGPGETLVPPACHDAALLRTALGEAPASEKVLALHRRACTLGFKNGCDAVERAKKR
jgi:TPR repeat protein